MRSGACILIDTLYTYETLNLSFALCDISFSLALCSNYPSPTYTIFISSSSGRAVTGEMLLFLHSSM